MRRAGITALVVAVLLGALHAFGRWYAARPLPGPPVQVSQWIRDGGLARRDR